MSGLRSGKCGVGISAGSRLVPECPDQLFELAVPLFSGTGSSSLRVKSPGREADQPSPSCAEVELQLHLFDFVVCTETNVPVSLPFVCKMFIRVVQLSCYRSKSAPNRSQVFEV